MLGWMALMAWRAANMADGEILCMGGHHGFELQNLGICLL